MEILSKIGYVISCMKFLVKSQKMNVGDKSLHILCCKKIAVYNGSGRKLLSVVHTRSKLVVMMYHAIKFESKDATFDHTLN